MGTFGKWFTGLVIIGLAACILELFTPWGAKAHSNDMGTSVTSALNSGGFKNVVSSSMSGNVAKLEGTLQSEEAKSNAISVAKNIKCEKCTNRREAGKLWHEVDASNVTVKKPVVAVSPYTLTGERTVDGGIVLNGYVHDEVAKTKLFEAAELAFPGKVSGNGVKIAQGAPTDKWLSIAMTNMAGLSKLDSGQFIMKDMTWQLSGQTDTVAKRASINASAEMLGIAATITVPNAGSANVGQVNDADLCQSTFDRIKGDTKIRFGSGSAMINDGRSLELLGALAGAAKQCSSFNITINGHTDSTGNEASNKALSKRRATAVADILYENGVVASQLFTEGHGQELPLATNGTTEGRAQNRRIEFTVTNTKSK